MYCKKPQQWSKVFDSTFSVYLQLASLPSLVFTEQSTSASLLWTHFSLNAEIIDQSQLKCYFIAIYANPLCAIVLPQLEREFKIN